MNSESNETPSLFENFSPADPFGEARIGPNDDVSLDSSTINQRFREHS